MATVNPDIREFTFDRCGVPLCFEIAVDASSADEVLDLLTEIPSGVRVVDAGVDVPSGVTGTITGTLRFNDGTPANIIASVDLSSAAQTRLATGGHLKTDAKSTDLEFSIDRTGATTGTDTVIVWVVLSRLDY